ncbi:MAG: DNA repair protein RecO [Candidatus Binatia bacterium]
MRFLCVTPAIVLRSWPYGESDKIVSFLTERHGKVTGIAKGAKRSRKRFVNTLEPFSLVNLRFQDRPHSTLAFVHACDLIRGFKDLTTSLEKIAHASYLVEIADGLTGEREENRPLFEHLREGLIFVEERGTFLSFLTFFELKLLKLSGYQPMLEHCRRCGRGWQPHLQAKWRFSPRDGGILCEFCSTFRKEAMPLSLEAINALTDLQNSNGILSHHLSLPPTVLKESRSVLLRFIQFQINRELKSAPFLDAFCFA